MDHTRHAMPLILSRDAGHLDDAEIWNGLSVHGAVLFHGYGFDETEFYQFASRFNRAFLKSPFGDRRDLSETNELQTVTIGQAALSLHFEYGNSPMRPDLLWFYCRRPPAEGRGGETVMADGVAIFDRLESSTQQALLQRRIKYTNFVPAEAFDAIANSNAIRSVFGDNAMEWLITNGDSTIRRVDEDMVALEFVAPSVRITDDGRAHVHQNTFTDVYKRPDHKDAQSSFSSIVTWEDGSEISKNLLDELKNAAHKSTRGIKWRAGDFVAIDNNRVMHGRRATNDPDRDILLLCSFSKRYVLPE